MASRTKQESCSHTWIVWDDGPTPIMEFEEGTDLSTVEGFVFQDPETRYAECDLCSKLINA